MGRAISPEFLADLKDGRLSRLSEAVRNDDTLLLALRGSYINVYYRGGSILRLVRGGAGDYVAFFDENYARYSVDFLGAPTPTIATELDCLEWVRAFPRLKEAMNTFFVNRPRAEREFQQLVAWENNRSAISNETEYFITDIEYADAEQQAKLDMLGFKWPTAARQDGSGCTPVFIEMKYGIGAYDGESGIAKHLADLDSILSDPAKKAALNVTITEQFAQLDELNLLRFNRSRAFKGIGVSGQPEVVLLLANHNPRSGKLLDVLQSITPPKHYDLRFFVASFAGYGMHEACMLPLDRFIELLERYPQPR